MLSNYFTIRTIVGEIRQDIEGSKIAGIYTQDRNRLVISFEREKHIFGLVLSCEPRLNYMYARTDVHRAKRNVLRLMTGSTGKRIMGIEVHPTDRQVVFSVDGDELLIVQLFGPKANVLYTGSDLIVIDSFLRPKELVGRPVPAPNEHEPVPDTYKKFNELLIEEGTGSVRDVLKKRFPTFGTLLVRELCIRAGINDDLPSGSMRNEDLTNLWHSYIELLGELDAPSPRIYFENNELLALSIIHLQQYYGKAERPFGICSEAVRTFVSISLRKKDITKQKKDIGTKLANEFRKTGRALEAAREELTGVDRRALYEKLGTILMANPGTETKGRDSIDLPDITGDNKPIRIAIDPRLDIIGNAERYFERARKARQSRTEAGRRIKTLEQRFDNLRSFTLQFDPIDDPKILKQFFRENQKLLDKLGIRMKKDSQEEIPFRVFTVAGDFEVWAGKNSANNDLLTMKYAKPHDLWFHARGAGGSHVVLRTAGSKAVVPKEAIVQAASIAAYYSRMRTSKLVPVTFTDRKYVRKRKGDPPGTVIVSREKVLMVEPKLPAAAAGTD